MTPFAFDLHNHSARSKDGVTPATELIDKAVHRGLRGLGICDHDTLPPDNAENLAHQARERGLLLIQGLEFSCRKSHVIGYWGGGIQASTQDMEFMRNRFELLDQNVERITRRILNLLDQRGIHVEFDALAEMAGKTPQKIFLFKYMCDTLGMFTCWPDARRYLRDQGIYMQDNEGVADLHPAQAVELIRRSGGVSIWAHPFLTPEEVRGKILPDMLDAGLDCLETGYLYRENGHNGQESNQELEAMAIDLTRTHGLLRSGGSDSHFPIKTWLDGSPLKPGDCGIDSETARPLLERLGLEVFETVLRPSLEIFSREEPGASPAR